MAFWRCVRSSNVTMAFARQAGQMFRLLSDVATATSPVRSDSQSDIKAHKVYFETYGCQMNVNDTEVVRSILLKEGCEEAKSQEEADLVLLMTCAIRESAENKVWRRVEQLKLRKRVRSRNQDRKPLKIAILGCMAERLKSKIIAREPSVDLVVGPDAYRQLPDLLKREDEKSVSVTRSFTETYMGIMPTRATSSVSAFVSIMRGCDNMCSYCIVPFTRGRERSRPVNSIVDEVKKLVDEGVKEVTLLGQNVNSFCDTSSAHLINVPVVESSSALSPGFSAKYKPKVNGVRFAELLDKVSAVDPDLRIRFTSPHPKDFPNELLQVMKERTNICKHIHLPAQSGSDVVLASMKRGHNREAYLNLVQTIRSFIPHVTLSSDFIAGFCGETEDDHRQTLELMNAVKYNYCFVFMYSMREKTSAFYHLRDDVPEETKKRRMRELYDTFRRSALELNRLLIGTEQLVLVEKTSRRSVDDWMGRNGAGIKVILPKGIVPDKAGVLKEVQPGDYVAVKVAEATSEVLKAKPLLRTSMKDFEASFSAPV